VECSSVVQQPSMTAREWIGPAPVHRRLKDLDGKPICVEERDHHRRSTWGAGGNFFPGHARAGHRLHPPEIPGTGDQTYAGLPRQNAGVAVTSDRSQLAAKRKWLPRPRSARAPPCGDEQGHAHPAASTAIPPGPMPIAGDGLRPPKLRNWGSPRRTWPKKSLAEAKAKHQPGRPAPLPWCERHFR